MNLDPLTLLVAAVVLAVVLAAARRILAATVTVVVLAWIAWASGVLDWQPVTDIAKGEIAVDDGWLNNVQAWLRDHLTALVHSEAFRYVAGAVLIVIVAIVVLNELLRSGNDKGGRS